MKRRGLFGAAAASALLPISMRNGASAAEPDFSVPAWQQQQGTPVTDAPYGAPSPYEKQVVRRPRVSLDFPTAGSVGTPLQGLRGIVTPNGLHYIRSHAGTPAIDPAAHRLVVHGMVERPLAFTMDDIARLPSISRLHFLECSGNTPLYNAGAGSAGWTAQDTHGLLSCAEWTGVRVADLLAEAGVQKGAAWVLAEGGDAAAMTRSVPLAKMLDDAILAYAQNGEALRPEQGYPLRLFLPGYEGNMSVKWLRRLKLGPQPWQTREETSKYTDLLPSGRAQQFVFVMEVKSVITRPSGGQHIPGTGFYEISGLAWSGNGRVTGVEVSADGGKSWQPATLQDPVLPKCLTRFTLPWNWSGDPALLQSRATDETGAVQPTREALLATRGRNFSYHYNAILSWRVSSGGDVALAL
jgi:sulfane dehydrogenase subunit SoxC